MKLGKFLLVLFLLSVFVLSFTTQADARWWTHRVRRLLVTQAERLFGYRLVGDSLVVPSTGGHAGDITLFKNVSGGALVQGDVVVHANSPIVVVDTVAQTAAVDTFTIADSLNGEAWPMTFYSLTYSLGDACSLDVYGLPYGSTTQVMETVVHATTGMKYTTTNEYWTKINLVVMRSFAANDSITCGAYHTRAVATVASGDAANPAGVVYIGGLDDKWVWVMRRGYMSNVKIDASSVEAIPGLKFNTSGTAKKGAPVSTPVDGAGIGTLLEAGSDDGTKACWINVE